MTKTEPRVLQVIDSLSTGGAERVAINFAHHLGESHYSALCVTRQEGPLLDLLNPDLPYCFLEKSSFWDFRALTKLIRFIRAHDINVVHAHSSSIFWVSLIKMFCGVRCVWHDHYGLSERLEHRPKRLLKLIKPLIDFVFVVNLDLKAFAETQLGFPSPKVAFLPNFPSLDLGSQVTRTDGEIKLCCLANLRPQKDHHNLLDAFEVVHRERPETRLYFIGKSFDDDYSKLLLDRVQRMNGVSFLGVRTDIGALLPQFDLGVLSSISEGLPMCILEFGICGVPVIATAVGQCSELFPNADYVVPAQDSSALAKRILTFIDSESLKDRARDFHEHIKKNYSREASLKLLTNTYRNLLEI